MAGKLPLTLTTPGWRRILRGMKPPRAPTRPPLPFSPFAAQAPAPVETFEVNDRVTHDRYGLGLVIGVETEIAVLIDFDGQPVRITSPYARLSKL